jgi:hypothetical protein
MLVRLGNVLYWVANGLAVVVLILGADVATSVQERDRLFLAAVFAAGAIVIFLIGRAIRYVFAGR